MTDVGRQMVLDGVINRSYRARFSKICIQCIENIASVSFRRKFCYFQRLALLVHLSNYIVILYDYYKKANLLQ